MHSGWVVYSDEAKTQLLGVGPQLIADHGAVSEPVAEALAVGARQRAGVEYALGVTGIAGPGGGSTDKPVGTVYIALVSPNAVPRVRRLRLPGERERVKYQASQAALDMAASRPPANRPGFLHAALRRRGARCPDPRERG